MGEGKREEGERRYRLISGDSHVLEPPDLWTSRVPARYRERAPRMQRFAEGDAWVLEGVRDPINFGLNASAGMDPDAMRPWMRWEDLRPGAFDPAARVAEQDRDFVDAELLYPTPRLSWSYIANEDAGFQLAMVQAYNDWLAEFCSHAPGRLCGLAMLPSHGVKQAVAELERATALPGIRGAILSRYPSGGLDLLPEDLAFFEAAAGRGIPLSIHVTLVTGMPTVHKTKLPGDVRFYDVPQRILQLIFEGVLDRFPRLRVVLAEVDCGWVPYFKEQIDDRYQRLHLGGRFKLRGLPSEYMDEHFYYTYITDHFGIRNREAIGVGRMMWSSDYPHVGADWPNSWRTIAAVFSGVPEAERDRILAGNARDLYRLGPSA
jgi:predicted TIM-barrel fold metal-dependent hydrolase